MRFKRIEANAGNSTMSLFVANSYSWFSVLFVGALLIFAWRCWFLYQKAQIPYLKISVQSSALGQSQLYYDRGYGFNEHDSVVKGLESSRQKLWGLLPWSVKISGPDEFLYYFQLPSTSLSAFKIQALNKSEKYIRMNSAIVNGLDDLILPVNFPQYDSPDDILKLPTQNRADNVFDDGRPVFFQENTSFAPPLKLDKVQLVQLRKFVVRAIAELFILLFVLASLVKLISICLSFSVVQRIWHKLICLRSRSIQNQLTFIILTIIFLWLYRPFNEHYFPMFFEKGLYIIFLFLTVRSFLGLDWKNGKLLVVYVGLFYLLLCVVSAGTHYFAVQSLGEENYLSYYKSDFKAILFDNYEWIKRLTSEGVTYIYLLPFMLVASASLFCQEKAKWRMLLWVSYLYLPCIFVAIYQVYVDSSFLNNRPTVDFVGGLAISFISFRILLFLLLPLYIFAFLAVGGWCKKVLFLIPIIAILWLARLCYGRASIFGILIFLFTLPIIKIWADGSYHRIRNYLVAGAATLLSLTVIAGILVPSLHPLMSQVLPEQLVRSSYSLVHGVKDVDPRQEMQAQALKLIQAAPIAGWGPSGFMKNVDRVRFVGGHESGVTQPMTSLYLGMLLDYGVFGLACIIILLCVVPLLMVLQVRKQIQSREEKLAVGVSFSVICVMLLLFNANPNIDYQDVLWVYVVYLGFLISVSLQYSKRIYTIRYKRVVLCGMMLVIPFSFGLYRTTYGALGYEKVQKDLFSFILQDYQLEEQHMLVDTKKLVAIQENSNRLIATRGNPLRLKYTTNVFHMVTSSAPYPIKADSNLVSFKATVTQQGHGVNYIIGLRVYLNNNQIEEHLFYTSGIKNLFYEIQDNKGEFRIELDLLKSIPYHEDERTEFSLVDYNPAHCDYGDLGVTVSAISYKRVSVGSRLQQKDT